MRRLASVRLLLVLFSTVAAAQTQTTVRAIRPPEQPFPTEDQSAGITRFSFIAYGDTRCDCGNGAGPEVQVEHERVIDLAVAKTASLASSPYPVRFAIQSGDLVYRGMNPERWDVFIPIAEKLTRAGLWYFFTVGNHDTTTMPIGDPNREAGLRNALAANAKLIPPDDSPRRLKGYPTYAFGYGNTFLIAFDSNVASDPTQLAWVTRQLDQLDRMRFPNVIAFFHHPPFSSGPHGGAMRPTPDRRPVPDRVEPQTLAIRSLYLPLFRKHHVRMTITGHDHLLDHWIERYEDGGKPYRMDHLVTGGGGAPTYVYNGDPDVHPYEQAASAEKVHLDHLMKPGETNAQNPHHFVLVTVDGDKLFLEVFGTGPTPYTPYQGESRIELR
ncbi:MAG TPA: metallophosphoesterase [Vicinamibacterales bacterium]|nr:metallophosphoesterase [Vicinamibacterales bacterium]